LRLFGVAKRAARAIGLAECAFVLESVVARLETHRVKNSSKRANSPRFIAVSI
jgi:hypothetical protein